MILPYKGKYPKIAPTAFIAPNATIIGDVEIAEGANIWYGAVVRGDLAAIRIGVKTNIQDNCTVHCDIEKPTIIGDHVTIGHNCVIHGCTIDDRCLVGINSVVLNEAHLKTGCVVAAGAVIKERAVAGPYQMLVGAPAQVKKEVPESTLEYINLSAEGYHILSTDHLAEVNNQRPAPGRK